MAAAGEDPAQDGAPVEAEAVQTETVPQEEEPSVPAPAAAQLSEETGGEAKHGDPH